MRNNITCSINCNYRISETLYTLETHLTVNTLNKVINTRTNEDDDDDDDDDDNNNNNNNNNNKDHHIQGKADSVWKRGAEDPENI